MDLPPPVWLTANGPDRDVALATRARLARNLAGIPFPWRATEGQRKHVTEQILDAACRAGGAFQSARQYEGDRLTAEQASRLIAWRYASPDWVRAGTHRLLLISPDAATSLLVNEEDHLRLQVILPGLQVESVRAQSQETLNSLATHMTLAYEDRIGWLTASLSNAGTGLRLSVLLHLPGLAASARRQAVLQAASEIGCSIRGLYGEGTEGTGELFQVSNTRAFDASVEQIAERVSSAARYLIDCERSARRERFSRRKGRIALEAGINEALTTLFAGTVELPRLLDIISLLRLAVAEGILPGDLRRTAEWVALAGVEAATGEDRSPVTDCYEAVRRSAALRQSIRRFMEENGTFPQACTE